MTRDEVFEMLRAIVARSFDVDRDSVSRSTMADDIDGWDSLAHSMLLIRIRKAFNLALDRADASNARTVGALADLLHACQEPDGSLGAKQAVQEEGA